MQLESERRRTKEPGERRQDLLDAAVRVFADKGVRAATVADITREAGVAKGTFYLYFDSKDHLVGALKEYFVDKMIDSAQQLFAKVGTADWWDLVDTTVETSIDFTLEHRDLIQLFAQESSTPATNELFAECVSKVHAMFAAGIRAGTQAGAFQVDDPDLVASLIQHAVDGTVVHAILYEPVDRDRLVATTRVVVRRILKPSAA